MVYIYMLCDPRPRKSLSHGQVCYVGKAVNLEERRKGHLYEATHGGKTDKDQWLRSLLVLGIEPSQVLLQKVPEIAEEISSLDRYGRALLRRQGGTWQDAERFWISWLRRLSRPLRNVNVGGNGFEKGHRFSEETLLKLSLGKRGDKNPSKRPEVAAAISKAKKGKPASPKWVAAIRIALRGNQNAKGYRHTEEAKRKIGLAARRAAARTAVRRSLLKLARQGHWVDVAYA